MTLIETQPRIRQLTRIDRRIDQPASNELDRAKELAAYLAGQLSIAERHGDSKVVLRIEESRELCQLLHDSLRTAAQIKGDRINA
jgi:hypothetical protein